MLRSKWKLIGFILICVFLVGCLKPSIYDFKSKLPGTKWAYKTGKTSTHKTERMVVKGSQGAISINIIRVNQSKVKKSLDEAVKAFTTDLKDMNYKVIGEKVYGNSTWKILTTQHKAYNILIKELVAFTTKGKSDVGIFFTATPKNIKRYKPDFLRVVKSLKIVPSKK